MKQITDILMSKQFLIGLGVGIAGVYAYNRYMTKEVTSNAIGRIARGGSVNKATGKNCLCGKFPNSIGRYCTSTCSNCCGDLDVYSTDRPLRPYN